MRHSSPIQRWVGIPLALLAALVLQTSLLAYVSLFGAFCELTLLVAIAVALEEGPEWGAASGFIAGMLIDLIGGLPLGISAFGYCLVGYCVGWFRDYMPEGPFVPIVTAALATAVGQGLVLGLASLLGQGTRGVGISLVTLTSAYNAFLAFLVLPAMHRMLRPRMLR